MASPATIEIDVQLELRDYLRANYWFMFHQFKWPIFLLFFGAVVYPLLILTSIVTMHETDKAWGFLIPWALLALWFAGTYFNTKKQLATNKPLKEKVHYTFSADGLETNAESFSSQTAWSNFYEAYETKSNFLIFVSKNMMYIVPKRSFVSAEQIESFKTLLRSQLDTKAKWK